MVNSETCRVAVALFEQRERGRVLEASEEEEERREKRKKEKRKEK